MSEVTKILDAIDRGETEAASRLLPLVYHELRLLARNQLRRETPGQTLQATALVHEAYLRLVGDAELSWQNRAHFFASAANAMRRILVDAARRKKRIKHGGGMERVDLAAAASEPAIQTDDDALALDEALERLGKIDHVKAELIRLKFFAGLSLQEAGQLLGLSPATSDRYWAFARAWLFRELKPG